MKTKAVGIALAIGAAAVFSLAPAIASADMGKKMTHCYGVNACKGKGSCKSASNACKGQNTCKGQGFVAMTKMQCDQVGGKEG
ncbi:MAG TPA: hypothetical protein VHZ76_05800 [Gammaproteobacteria bacterium]|nr:hypothetical protein [Gammaproteobacteria bacterium]